jgi:phosphatidylserine/phosphatidylglycerophosphate/cardiolipin synthase-like enzyme
MNQHSDPDAELVVTVPEPYCAKLTYRSRCRTTLGVLTQLITEAEQHIVIAAPFMQSGFGLSSGPLALALQSALCRGVNVDVLSTERSLQTVDLAGLSQNARGQLRLFTASASLTDDAILGSHAKFCVADGEKAYVGSANLTGRGLSGQLEMGVLIQGAAARQVDQFWDFAVEVGLIVLVP